MATLSTSNKTLADWAKEIDPDGKVATVAELLSQTNEILTDCVFKEGNLPTGEQVSIRTGLPEVYYRAINEGIPSSKATSAQVTEACALLEARSRIDCDLAELNGNSASFRLSEDMAFLEAMNQEQASAMFYGDPSTNPKEFLGLSERYSSLSGGNAQNILSAGGAGADNTSIYLVVWGDNTVYCPFPKGSKAGLDQQDLGEKTVYNSDGTSYQAYETLFKWKNGLVVKDWRYVVRIPNIDVSDLLGQTGTQAASASTAIIKLMQRALYRIPNMRMGKACFYMNRTVHSGLSIAAMDKSNSVLKVDDALDQFGRSHSWMTFQGVPLRQVDALLDTESVVS